MASGGGPPGSPEASMAWEPSTEMIEFALTSDGRGSFSSAGLSLNDTSRIVAPRLSMKTAPA